MAKRPLIGVTGPDNGGLMAWLMTALALWRCGARPIRITARREVDLLTLQAIVIGGGTDVDPLHYDEPPLAADTSLSDREFGVIDWTVGLLLTGLRITFARHSHDGYDHQRDALEKRVIGHAIALDLPILGICRGAQLMNVALGGSLHQDISSLYSEGTNNVRSILPCKTVSVATDSRLLGILGTKTAVVNALHRQSVKVTGTGVIVAAVESSGIVQAIEKRDHRFFVGVQWHPEYLPQSQQQLGLFRALVECIGPPSESIEPS